MKLEKKLQVLVNPWYAVGLFTTAFFALTLLFTSCASSRHTAEGTRVSIQGNRWLINEEPVHAGSPAEGLLMNVRMVNAAFEDAASHHKDRLQGFDPNENTDRFIQNIPDYHAQGVLAFTISLQGGFPGYEGAVNTAFNADGSLRETYMNRIGRIIKAADQQGVVIILSCFYQRQHSHGWALEGKQAIKHAVANVANWIKEQEFSNVALEVSNEYAHGGYSQWKDGDWLRSDSAQVELIKHARSQAPNLLVSTSGMGNGIIAAPIARAADFILIHFNNTALANIPERIEQARAYGKPVLCNEDDKIGQAGADAALLSVKSGAGWGLMHSEKNQSYPFEFEGAADDSLVYRMLARLTGKGASIDEIPIRSLSVVITEPKDGDTFLSGQDLTFRAVATGLEEKDSPSVHFFVADQLIGSSDSSPWECVWKNALPGKHKVVAVVLEANGQELLRSRQVDFEVRPEGQENQSFSRR